MPATVDTVLLGCAHALHARSYAGALEAGRSGRLVGVYDESAELGGRLAEELGVDCYRDPQHLLESLRPAAAIVCGSTAEHRGLVTMAAAHGVHILCEKPLALSPQDASAMVRACGDAGVQLHTAFVSRFYPVLQEVRAVITGSELGQVRGMVGGNRGRPPLPPRYPRWITEAERAGGGALIDHSVHVLDAMRFVSGLEASEVAAEIGTLFGDTEVEDSALVSVVFDSGAVASIDPSWSVMPESPWDYDFYLRVLGTEGSLSIATGRESVSVSGQYDGRSFVHVPFEPDIDQTMVDAFLRSVQEGHVLDPCASGEDGLRAVELATAAYESAATGKFVPVSRDRDG